MYILIAVTDSSHKSDAMYRPQREGGVQQIYFEAIVPAVTLQSRLWVLEWPSVHVESQVLISFFFVSRQIGRILVSPKRDWQRTSAQCGSTGLLVCTMV